MNSCNQKHTIYTGETVGLVLAMYEDDGITPVTLEDKVMRVVVAQGKDGKPGPSGKPPYIGETGIEVGMYGKSNYEEVISYDDLKSKLGL